MAARRLVIVMIVLLAVSTLAAAFIPAPKKDKGAGTTTTQQNPQRHPASGSEENPEPPAAPGLVNARVHISNEPPKEILVPPGDQLVLEVSGSFGDDVEVPELGIVETMSPFAPAVFDLVATDEGTFGVRTVETNLLVARIVVQALPKPAVNVPVKGSSTVASAGSHGVKRGVAAGP